MKELRREFPIFREQQAQPLIYLDNAATTQKPDKVIDAVRTVYTKFNANIHRAQNSLSFRATEEYERAHVRVAEFIGAKSMEEVVFTKNATESLNLLARSLGSVLQEGDEILLTVMEHHANLIPWQQIAKERRLTLKFAAVQVDGTLDIESFVSQVSPRTKIASFTHVSNALGTLNPISQLITTAKAAGATVVVDGAQSVPHMPVNVANLGCDFLVFSSHKMLGPSGVGVLYGRQELLEAMDPFLTGGDMISSASLTGAQWNTLPWKFEAGTPNIEGAIGLAAAIDFLEDIGIENIYLHEQELTKYAWEQLSGIPGVTLYGPEPAQRAGIISFNIEGVHPHDVSAIFDQHGIIIRAGQHCAQPLLDILEIFNTARISFYLYNSIEEVDAVVRAVHAVQRVFRI